MEKLKILVLDNYDSFTFNLVHMLEKLASHSEIQIFRNDEISLNDVNYFDMILLSPGPSLPDDAGILKPLIKCYAPSKSILGICLGHQAIAEVFGAELYNIDPVKHGVIEQLEILVDDDYLYNNIMQKSPIGLYHSWAVNQKSISDKLAITAVDSAGRVMGLTHTQFDVKGLQFHPESILTKQGEQIMSNWLTKGAIGNRLMNNNIKQELK